MFREHLDLALARAVRHGSATAVLYLDLDCFKLVNDSLGHAAGDEVLREAAGRLARAVRASDLVARVGGDEFIVLLADLEPDAAADIAQLVASAVHAALGDAFVVSGTEFYVGASIGVAFHQPGGDQQRPDADTLLEHADIAMYDAKQSGTPTEVYTRPAGEPRERLALMTRLRKAVQQLDFVLHWLPIIDLDTQRVCGAEALVRWRDPERGWVMPSEFVTLVEEAGLIDRLGAWVLSEAAAQQRAWQSAGLDLEVTVNMSGRQLWRPGAVEEVLDQITSAGADPRRIMLELTETAAGRGPERAEQTLGALRAAGVRIAIDDFADSPLMALSRMEVDVLKIGGALVRAVERPDGEAMVHALVQLSQNLGIWPVAECIETRAQYEALRDAGCRFGQGHFFGHSLPPADVPDYVRRFTLPREYDPWVAWEASRARELIAA